MFCYTGSVRMKVKKMIKKILIVGGVNLQYPYSGKTKKQVRML